jgi:hypothetical protein
MTASSEWLADLRKLHDKAFDFPWGAHVIALNEQYGFKGDKRLSLSIRGLPPVWFNGDLKAIEPGTWVLTISLNHQADHYADFPLPGGPEAAWRDYRVQNREHWYPQFFLPLVRLAATALGEHVPTSLDAQKEFATTRMVFVELCPYASNKFSLSGNVIAELCRTDEGFKTAAQFNRILIEQAEPALILVNGAPSVKDFAEVHASKLDWQRVSYASFSNPARKLWHYQGWYRSDSRKIPVVGFPFLGKSSTHNSNADRARLAALIQAFVRGESHEGIEPVADKASEAPGPRYWLMPCGSIGDGVLPMERLRRWLSIGLWGMGESTPNRKHLRQDDNICFYVSGVGVAAAARLTKPADTLFSTGESPDGAGQGQKLYRLPLADVMWLSSSRRITDVRSQLEVFRGRDLTANPGWYVQTTRSLTRNDFAVLTGKA